MKAGESRKLGKIIFYNESRKAYGRKRTFLFHCFMPAVFVLLYSMIMYQAQETGQGYNIHVYCENAADMEILKKVEIEEKRVVFSDDVYDENNILNGKVTVAIRVEDEICISYSEELVSNVAALYKAENLAREFVLILADEKAYEESQEIRREIIERDLAYEKGKGNFSFSLYFPTMCFFLIGFTNSMISSLAIDLIAGEKERGVYDAVVLSGVSRKKLLTGKLKAIMLGLLPSFIIGCIAALIGCCIFNYQLYDRIFYSLTQWKNILVLLMLSFGFVLLSSSVYLLVASNFNTKKAAYSYSSIGTLLLSSMGIVQYVAGSNILKYIPVVNLIGAVEDIMNNSVNAGAVICNTVIAVMLSGVLLMAANHNWGGKKDD